MSMNTPETDTANYVEALFRIETSVWSKYEEIARDLGITSNEIIALSITELHSRLINVKEGRLLLSISADARFYTSTLEMHLAEADPVYARVLKDLNALPIGPADQDDH
ncbi:hypothetical protein EV645_8125 [Kribbella rubisoli]|uniref:Uncharacterized protein n=2 Tax=Kribbella rubisoli TaxID=3075929 RepID=A0A4Q7VXK3_9ACTN|nr:hypothetical protein EV645_8125 [Kribbella rubisoli]